MSEVKAQYEAFPYPARDPADEAKRLITGSPSHVLEIDHFLFQGRRDWTKPLRALIAGGGTGDGLIQLAQSPISTSHPHPAPSPKNAPACAACAISALSPAAC